MTPIEKKETLKVIPQIDERGILILRIVGFIDASNINLFVRQVQEQLNKKYSKVILDFSELQYMYINNSAIGIFLKIHQLAAKHQEDIRILNLPREIEKTFVKLGLTKYFQMFSEEKKAIQSFHERGENELR